MSKTCPALPAMGVSLLFIRTFHDLIASLDFILTYVMTMLRVKRYLYESEISLYLYSSYPESYM